MIVLDASAAVDLLLGVRPAAGAIAKRLRAVNRVHVPQLFDLEVLSALRGHERAAGGPAAAPVSEALRNLAAMRAVRHGHELLRPRIWALRDQLTAYDAAYVALAEVLDAPLLTCDSRLAGASGHRVRVELIAG